MPILWFMIPDKSKQLLATIQWDRYGLRLEDPRFDRDVTVEPAVEDREEIDQLMRQTRKSFK